LDPNGPVVRSPRRRCVPDLVVITDVCMCERTDHGHCGRFVRGRDGRVSSTTTPPEPLAKVRLSRRAGVTWSPPSDDGRAPRRSARCRRRRSGTYDPRTRSG
jgi:porphobilinogen synthase